MIVNCAKCGKSREGYGTLEFGIMDGQYYCKEHLPAWRYATYRYESSTTYYRSFTDILKVSGKTIRDYVRVQEYSASGPRWGIYLNEHEYHTSCGLLFCVKYRPYHVAVVYGDIPDEIKDMEISEGNETTWKIADPTLKFVCGNCRNARYYSKCENKGADTDIFCCVYPQKHIKPTTPACIDLKDEYSIFNSEFNPVGLGGYSSSWEYNDREKFIGKRLIP